MRNHFAAELLRMAQEDPSIYVMTGDLGYGVWDKFAETYPDRFINAGISEEHMTAAAAGLALEGNTVYTYSIGNFPGMRCLEWIRNDICYHHANVKILAVGGGFAYGQLGMSHHATEDIAIMRALPGMRVYAPADAKDAVATARQVNAWKGPCYIRLGKGKEPDLSPGRVRRGIEKIIELEKGEDIAVVSFGPILAEAIKAASILKESGIKIGLYQAITMKPLDERTILAIAQAYKRILVLEEHNRIGGLGSAVAEQVAGLQGAKAVVEYMGLRDVYPSIVGSQEYLRDFYGLSARYIVEKVEKLRKEEFKR